jgi:flagellar hook-length control protein FliK
MVQLSFHNITGSNKADQTRRQQASDVARLAQESFESHLQKAQPATEPRQTTSENRERDVPESGGTASPAEQPEHSEQDSTETNTSSETHDATEEAPANEADDEQTDLQEEQEVGEEANVTAVAVEQELLDETVADESEDDATEVAPAAQDTAGEGEDEHQRGLRSEIEEGTVVSSTDVPDEETDGETGANEREVARSQHSDTVQEQHGETNELVVQEAAASDRTTTPRRTKHKDIAAAGNPAEANVTAVNELELRAIDAETDLADDEASGRRRGQRDVEANQSSQTPRVHKGDAAQGLTPGRFAEHLLNGGVDRGGRGTQIPSADQARLVDRVARAFHRAEGTEGTLRLRLSPPELGSLRLEITLRNGALSARLETETPAARSLLLDNLPVLRDRLAEQGVRVEQFDVDLLDRHSSGTPDGLEQQGEQPDDTPHESNSRQDAEEPSSTTNNQITTTIEGDEQLNVIV